MFCFSKHAYVKFVKDYLQTFRNNRIRYKLAYFIRNLETSLVNHSKIIWIKNVKFSGYCFYMNINYREIVPLKHGLYFDIAASLSER